MWIDSWNWFLFSSGTRIIRWMRQIYCGSLVHIGYGLYGLFLSWYEGQSIGFESKLCRYVVNINLSSLVKTTKHFNKNWKKYSFNPQKRFSNGRHKRDWSTHRSRCARFCRSDDAKFIAWRMEIRVLGDIRHLCRNHRRLLDLGVGRGSAMEFPKKQRVQIVRIWQRRRRRRRQQ